MQGKVLCSIEREWKRHTVREFHAPHRLIVEVEAVSQATSPAATFGVIMQRRNHAAAQSCSGAIMQRRNHAAAQSYSGAIMQRRNHAAARVRRKVTTKGSNSSESSPAGSGSSESTYKEEGSASGPSQSCKISRQYRLSWNVRIGGNFSIFRPLSASTLHAHFSQKYLPCRSHSDKAVKAAKANPQGSAAKRRRRNTG